MVCAGGGSPGTRECGAAPFRFSLIRLWVMTRQGRGDVVEMLSSGLGEVWTRGGGAVPGRGAGDVSPMGARSTEGKGLL
jgi:hypothetical protein